MLAGVSLTPLGSMSKDHWLCVSNTQLDNPAAHGPQSIKVSTLILKLLKCPSVLAVVR